MTPVVVRTYQHTCHSHSSGGPCGDWSDTNEYIVDSVSLNDVTSKRHYLKHYDRTQIAVCGELNIGDNVYVLVLRYGTGDSFGHSSGNGEIIWAFADLNTANKAAEDFQKHEDDYTIKLTVEDGSIVEVGNPANGYFEDIESLTVLTFVVEH